MGRKKTEFHASNKVLQKISSQSQARSRTTKKSSHKDTEEMDSLSYLKDLRGKKDNDRLDEKIKLLKSELKMLFGNSESDHNCLSGSENVLVRQDQEVLADKYDKKKTVEKKSEINSFKAEQLKAPPLKFSEWLDKTIDKIDVRSQDEKPSFPRKNHFSQCDDLLLNSNLHKASTPEKFCTSETSYKSKLLNSSIQSQDKVEQWLYQSLYLQNFNIYLSSSDENDPPDQMKPTKALKLQKEKTRKSCKSKKVKSYQSNSSRYWKSPYRRKRKKRTVNNFSSISNEHLVCYSVSDTSNVMGEKHIDCMDLDVTDYDWNEPFDIDENSQLSWDIEILDNPEERKNDNREIRSNNYRPSMQDLDSTINKSGVQSKTGWECPICFEQSRGQEVMATQCGHVFCRKCLESYISKFSKNCPTCRLDLTNKPPITLFNF